MMAPTTFTIQKYGKHIHNIASPVFHKLIDFHHVPPEPFFQLKKKSQTPKNEKKSITNPYVLRPSFTIYQTEFN